MPVSPLIVHDGDAVDLILLTPLFRILAERSGRPCRLISRSPLAPAVLGGEPSVLAADHLPGGGWLRRPPVLDGLRAVCAAESVAAWLIGAEAATMARQLRLAPASLVATDAQGPAEHRSLWGLRQAGRDGDLTGDWSPPAVAKIDPRPALAAAGEPTFDVLVVTDPAWAAERWASLVVSLRAIGKTVQVVGPPAMAAADSAVPCHDPAAVAAVLAAARGCAACIGSDAWPTYVAAAVDRPVVLLAGERDPRIERPLVPALELVSPLPPAQVPDGADAWRASCRMAGISPRMVMGAYARLGIRR